MNRFILTFVMSLGLVGLQASSRPSVMSFGRALGNLLSSQCSKSCLFSSGMGRFQECHDECVDRRMASTLEECAKQCSREESLSGCSTDCMKEMIRLFKAPETDGES